jgi:MFS family permease
MNADNGRGRAWSITFLLFLFMMVNYIDKVAIGLVAVPLIDEFGLTPSQFGLVASSFYWLFPIACVGGGFLANRFQAKWLLLGMALIWSLSQLPILFATSVTAVIFARVLLGVGEGPASPLATHAVFKWFPNSERNLPQTVILMGATVGLMVASLTVPLITARWGWRFNFGLLALIGVAWMIAWMVFGAEGTIGVEPRGDGNVPATRVPAIPYRRLFADSTIWSAMVLHFVADWSVVLSMTWLPVYLQKGLGFDAIASGRLFGLIVMVSVPINLFVSWWSQRMLTRGIGSRAARGVLSSLAVAIAGILMIGTLLPGLSAMQKVCVLAVAIGLSITVFTLAISIIGEVTPTSQRGALLSISNAVATVGTLPAPIVTGWLIESTSGLSSAHGYELGFGLTGALMVLGAAVGFIWNNPERSILRLARLASR